MPVFRLGPSYFLSGISNESYLLADEVLEKLVVQEGKSELLEQVLQMKLDALSECANRNDLKSAAGRIYNGLRSLLNLKHRGSNSDHFMRDTLACLVVPGMETYEKLHGDIVTRLEQATA